VSVTVRPPASLADQPLHIGIFGLAPGAEATVEVRSTDARDVRWLASATYHADARGEIDVSQTRAISGSYLGISGMGLIWSMHPIGADPAGAYFWNNATPLRFTATVVLHGAQVASTSFRRQFSLSGLTYQSEWLQADGFSASSGIPSTLRPAVRPSSS
jgi:hypothetical protein